MPAKLDQYEAGALSAWTPASQAAMNAERYDRQILEDANPAFEAFRDEERKAREANKVAQQMAKADRNDKEYQRLKEESKKLDEIWGPAVSTWDDEKTKEGQLKKKDKAKKEQREDKYEEAEAVTAGQVVDNIILSWNPPIHGFLNVFGPPHIVIIFYFGLHIYYWFKSPWYLRFLIYQPTIYFIPLWSALTSLKDKKVRLLWIVYFMQLAIIEYFELLFYRDRARSSVMFLKLKAFFCLISYTIVNPAADPPVYGAIRLIKFIFPPPGSPKLTPKEKREAKAARIQRTKRKAEEDEKALIEQLEKERQERWERQAQEAEWLEEHS